MAIRMTGMYSGLDTDSIIQEMVSARRTKVDSAKKAQTKLSWKQDAWKNLNTKLKNLQTKFLANMRFTTSYSKKVTKTSNDSAVSVLTGENAVNGVQELKVKHLAKTAYLTGAEIKSDSGEKLTALSKLTDINPEFKGGNITATIGGETKVIDVAADATISDVLTELKNLGLNASFDEKNQRMFVSAKESGEAADFTLSGSGRALTALGLSVKNNGATKIDGQDAEIELNNATFKSSKNTFEINGLTITALNTTKEDEVVTVTTEQDTDGIYDMVKNFLKEYNAVINEMDKLYNADAAKGYEPLTEEEKEAMSESEIEEWEKKVKDSLLRRDENLSNVMSGIREAIGGGIEVGGKTLYLHDFGINTLGYFNAADNEKHALHIDGDPDNEFTSGNADKLKSMIAGNPDTVIAFFSKLSQNVYDKMTDLSKSRDGYRSFGNFYDDKKMKTDYTDYTSKIQQLEKKLADYEDSWYAKFSKMETALAKMQSNTNAVTSLLGG
ncbi:MAG: flagellar filament capping protein FliD [Lachnospiraceae bacterium]|nr:flagellar filament capping protein FliD [Lachnospiraceae bacterium]